MLSGIYNDRACIHVSTKRVLQLLDEYEPVDISVRRSHHQNLFVITSVCVKLTPCATISFHGLHRSIPLVPIVSAVYRCDDEYTECSAKHNRGVSEVFHEAARVALTARATSGQYTPPAEKDRSCIVM